MPEHRLAVEMEAALLKAVLLERTKDGYAVLAAHIHETPAGAIVGGRVVQPEAVAAALRKLLEAARVNQRECFIVIGKQNVTLRAIQMPVMPDRDLRDAVRWEIGKYLHFPLEEAVIDYTGVREIKSEDGNKLEVYLAAAQKEVVYGYLEAAERAGVFPAAVDVDVFALYRLMMHQQQTVLGDASMAQISLLLEVGVDASNIMLTKGDRLVSQRVVPLGSNTDAAVLCKEAQRSVDYFFYNSPEREGHLKQAWLTGIRTGNEQFLAQLRENMEIEPQILDPFAGMKIKLRNKTSVSELSDAAPHLAVACGLALRGWRRASQFATG